MLAGIVMILAGGLLLIWWAAGMEAKHVLPLDTPVGYQPPTHELVNGYTPEQFRKMGWTPLDDGSGLWVLNFENIPKGTGDFQ